MNEMKKKRVTHHAIENSFIRLEHKSTNKQKIRKKQKQKTAVHFTFRIKSVINITQLNNNNNHPFNFIAVVRH